MLLSRLAHSISNAAGRSRRLSWQETAEAFHTSWDRVCDAVEYVVGWGLEHCTLESIRAAESRRMAKSGHEPMLKKSRWCVLKRKEHLTSKQQPRPRDLLRYNLQTVRAYLLKEDFQQFWKHNSPRWAGMFLDFWRRQTMRSRIEPMKKIVRTLRAHRALLLNYFNAKKQFSSGVAEGLNKQSQGHHEKSVWLPHLPYPGTRALSLTWQAAGTKAHP